MQIIWVFLVFLKESLIKLFFFLILCVLPSQFDFYSVGLHITGPCIRSHRLESKGEWGPRWKSSWREKGLTWVKQPWPPTWILLKDATLSWWNESQASQELQTGNSWKIQNKKSLKPWLPIKKKQQHIYDFKWPYSGCKSSLLLKNTAQNLKVLLLKALFRLILRADVWLFTSFFFWSLVRGGAF